MNGSVAIFNSLLDILKMKYSDLPTPPGGSNMGSYHESHVEEILKTNGLTRVKRIDTPLSKKDIKDHCEDLPEEIYYTEPVYLKNPLGGSRHPDFVILYMGSAFYLELKSSKSAVNPKWGSAFPCGKVIWVFTCGYKQKTQAVDETTIFLGEHRIPDGWSVLLKRKQNEKLEFDRQWNKEVRELTQGMAEDQGTVSADLRPPKLCDAALKSQSVLYHPDREFRERETLLYVWDTLHPIRFTQEDPIEQMQRNWETSKHPGVSTSSPMR